MKYLLLLLAGALTVAAADVTGNWKGTLTAENRDPSPALLILKQTGDTVTGSGGPDDSEQEEIANGKIAGDKLTFVIHQERGPMSVVLTINGDTMTGQASRERDGQQQTARLELKRETK